MKVLHWILTMFSILILAGVGYDLFLLHEEPQIEVYEKITIVREKQVYFERMEINHRIQEIQAYEDYDKVIALYGEIAGDREIAMLILNNALVKKIPVNLAFALCKQESSFDPQAIGKNVRDGVVRSIDYGLFQLNTVRFKSNYIKHGTEWAMVPENNVETGLRALRDLYEQHGSYDMAIIKYNGRFSKGADMHLVNVYKWERRYDKLFNNL